MANCRESHITIALCMVSFPQNAFFVFRTFFKSKTPGTLGVLGNLHMLAEMANRTNRTEPNRDGPCSVCSSSAPHRTEPNTTPVRFVFGKFDFLVIMPSSRAINTLRTDLSKVVMLKSNCIGLQLI